MGSFVKNLKREMPNHTVKVTFDEGDSDKSTLAKDFFNSDGFAHVVIDNRWRLHLHTVPYDNENLVRKLTEKVNQEEGSTLYWNNECSTEEIADTQKGLLSTLMNNLNNAVGRGKDTKITQSELNEKFLETFTQFQKPYFRVHSDLEHQSNIIKEDIMTLQAEKKEMETKARKFINRYHKALFGVEWLGWDIIEPITYSLDQLTLFLGLVFYYRFGICREHDTMLEASLNSHLKNDKALYEKYNSTL